MNPTEIYEALAALAAKPYDPVEFPFDFALATDNAPATVAKLRGGTFNKSDLPGGVLMNQKFHFAPAMPGMSAVTLDALRASKRTLKHKPAILIAADGVEIAAEHPKSGDILHGSYAALGDRFGFFLPAAGKERYRAAEENPVDVKVSGKLAKLYDALIWRNPDWATEARRHDMNQLMTRLIFCLFAEDVGIFPDNQFSRLIFTHAGDKGEGMREVLISAFTAMNTPRDRRDALPAWSREFEYVNGGLFAGVVDAPVFDAPSARYLRDVSAENWKGINPDIFGSMIQSVADAKLRSELGMHYTSVPNIMKVLGPLFLDDLDAEINRAWDRERGLRQVLDRIGKIRVFDPACGSGNFLVVAYRALREREIRILARVAELSGGAQTEMWSVVPIRNFYGIDLADFAVETAKLALFIAEYQANALFQQAFGRKPADLPLRDAANIVRKNALRVNWEQVCPAPEDGGQVFIAGNPPWIWSNDQSDVQKAEIRDIFSERMSAFGTLDYVSGWLMKAADYVTENNAACALVATNSITQGQSVPFLWPTLLGQNIELHFAHSTFKWSNNASGNATVDAVILGLARKRDTPKRFFHDGFETKCSLISPYLIPSIDAIVDKSSTSLFGLPSMDYGSKPIDGGQLILSPEEASDLRASHPEIGHLIKRLYGSDELIYDRLRYCLHIDDSDLPLALSVPEISDRIENVRESRKKSTDAGARKAAQRAHQFREHRAQMTSAIYIPAVSSENRLYLTPIIVGANDACTNRNFVLYDAPDWCLSVLSSSLHRLWVLTVCGKLQKRPNYSNTLGWNTFPVPNFTSDQLEALNTSSMAILRTRYGHYPATIAELYDPKKMPDDLRTAHKANDDLLEAMYIGRPFRNDTERLEHLFKLYAAKIKKTKKQEAA